MTKAHGRWWRAVTAITLLSMMLWGGRLLPAAHAAPAGAPVVISQVYGGGGNSGASFTNDFIELFNRSANPVSLSGWSVQYASATGTGSFAPTTLGGTLQPGQYFLVKEASGGATGAALPSADATGTINMSGTAGKVALANISTSLGCNGGSTPCSGNNIVDLVGYGNATYFEGSGPAPTLSNTTAALRASGGCTDTNSNSADFTATAPSPRNSASPLNLCPVDPAPFVSNTNPSNGATGTEPDANITITFSEPVTVSDGWYDITCDSGAHTAGVSGGPSTFTLDPDTNFNASERCSVTVRAANVQDSTGQYPTSDYSFSFTVAAPPTPIHEIQGASHLSPLSGKTVTTSGVVTALRTNGFYMQDPTPDADPATSEGIFVFTTSAPRVTVGHLVRVTGKVSEFRPGGDTSGNLTTTELSGPTVTDRGAGPTIAPTVITASPSVVGDNVRHVPTEVIEDDANGSVETGGTFDPQNDGIDFYESLEGMLVQVNDAVAVGPTNAFGETPYLPDNGDGTGLRTPRGGIVTRPNDFNPERIIFDDSIVDMPQVNVGDHLYGSTLGVLDYNFGNFMLEVTSRPAATPGGLTREVTTAPNGDQIAVATFNVENLDPTDPQSKFDALAHLIVTNLQAPDIVAVEEIQDNNGPKDDGTVDAAQTYGKLIAAIAAAGGPTYQYRQINPVNDQDGGEPGGNIRVGFLFRTDRGLSFVERPGGGPTSSTTVVDGPNGPQLSASPGRIDPTNPAFDDSRKPLAGEFIYQGNHFFVIANHFNSKGGDEPVMGADQPAQRSSEVQRHQQAQIVNDFVDSILARDPSAEIVVLGDLNDYQFSDTLTTLKGGVLHDLVDTLPENERYTYVFEGNSQVLDHILLSDELFNHVPFQYDAVHVNSEFADQASDHDPQVVRLSLPERIPPVITVTGVSDGATYVLGSVPAAGCSTSDDQSGVSQNATLTVTGGTPNGVGTFTATCSGGTDRAGNVAPPVSVTYSVRYSFAGFTSPVDNAPALNTVNAGRTVPVKWSLHGVTALSSVRSISWTPVDCSTLAPSGSPTPVASPGSTDVHYDAAADQFIENLATSKSWAGSCRTVTLTLDDNTQHSAAFQFR